MSKLGALYQTNHCSPFEAQIAWGGHEERFSPELATHQMCWLGEALHFENLRCMRNVQRIRVCVTGFLAGPSD